MKFDTKTKQIVKWIWIIVFSPFLLLTVLIILANWGVFGRMPTFEDLENPQSKLATEIYAEDKLVSSKKSNQKESGSIEGNVLLGTFHLENRSHISYEELSPNLVKALIATEDARFIQHSGIDFIGLGRVFFKTVLLMQKKAGGGSTISQQLALNLFAERNKNFVKRVIQKLQEWITAVKLERNYTKSEIIAMYFNTVPFGSNAYGIRSASQTFFRKQPSELNVEEAALMVGVVNAPSRFSPVRNPENAQKRRNLVIGQMHKYGYLTIRERDSLQALPITLNFTSNDHNSGLATYFREMLRQTMRMKKPERANYKYRLKEDFIADSLQWENNPLYGWCNKNLKNGRPYDLDRDGLKIYTTIDSRMQAYAEQAVEEHLSKTLQPAFDAQKKSRKRFPFSNRLKEIEVNDIVNQAIRSTDRYRAMRKAGVAEESILRSFEEKIPMTVFTWNNNRREIDTVMTPRDSIYYYKSLLRTAFMAMEPHTGRIKAYVGGPNFRYFKYDNAWQGRRQVGSTIKPFLYTLAMQEGMKPCDEVINNHQMVPLPDGTFWEPASSEKEKYIGKNVTLKWGLTNSSNNVSAWLIQRFSPQSLIELCHRMGITSYMDPVPAICLGAADLSLFQMVGAYNTYPSGGIHIDPYFVSRIEDNNGNLLTNFTKDTREVISKETAYKTINLMQGVVNQGTGMRARSYVPSAEIAGKTGTTNKHSDGWFIAYVPKLTAGVWVGNEDRGSYLLGDGARMALPIWGLFFKKVMADPSLNIRPTDKFEVPAGVDTRLMHCSGGTGDEEEYDESGDESEHIFFTK